MQIIMFLFVMSFPVLACKMTPEAAKNKAETAAIDMVAKKLGHRNLKAWKIGEHWLVRTTRLNCEEYKVNINHGKGNCKTSGKIISTQRCP